MIVIWEGTCAFIVELSVALCSCFHYYPFFLSFSLSQLRFLFLLCLRFVFSAARFSSLCAALESHHCTPLHLFCRRDQSVYYTQHHRLYFTSPSFTRLFFLLTLPFSLSFSYSHHPFFLLLETWGLYCTTCPSRWRLFDFFFSPPSLGFAKCASGSGQVWRLLCFDFFFCYSFVLCGQCRSRALTEHRGSDIMLALYFSTSI